MKFLVLKHDDIDKVLENKPYIGEYLYDLCEGITELRLEEHRVPDPKYVVINQDEPYINEIIEIMNRHRHWDEE